MRMFLGTILLAAATTAAAAAHEYKVGGIEIGHPWARPAKSGNGAVYLTIENDGGAPDRLIRAEAAVAKKVEMHATTLDAAGVAKMVPLQALEVPAKGEAAFTPGGNHIMLVGLKDPLKEGRSFPLTLTFEKAGSVKVDVAVETSPSHGAGAEHEHDEHTDMSN